MSNQTYTVTMANQTIIASSELITIRAATAWASRASLLEVLRITVSQQTTEVSEQLGVRFGLKASAFGTFTSVTPAPATLGSVASAIVGSTSNAASSTGVDASANGAGTLTVMYQEGFNNLNGFLWVPVPEERVLIGPDISFVVQMDGTATVLTNWNATLTFRELT